MKRTSEVAKLTREIRALNARINDLQFNLKTMADRLAFSPLGLPPEFVLKAARDALKRTEEWQSCYKILAAWYAIPVPFSYWDEREVPKDAIACYVPGEHGTIYSKTKEMGQHTGIHEFAHHLADKKFPIGGETEQAFCDAYANEVLKVWNRP